MGCGASIIVRNPTFEHPGDPGPITASSFEYISMLGEGGFAQVKSAIKKRSSDRIIYAIKEINLTKIIQSKTGNKNGIKLLINELNVLKQIESHPFIVKLHYAFHHEVKAYFVFDSFFGGDLRLHLRHGHIFSETSVAYYLACIGSALYHLHLKNILHRDIKPENIVLDHYGVPYLTDFGISYAATTGNRVALCDLSSGTLAYLAPEVLTPSHRHSFQSDYWSLGVVGYELLFGRRPFQKHCPREFVYFVENNYRHVWNRLESEDSRMFDWSDEGLLLSGDEVTLPYPSHFIPLLPDGNLPEILRARYPQLLLCGLPTTDDCMDLLDALLDVRIHQRFGIISQYARFSHHPWFVNQLHLEHIKKPLRCVTPPFVPDPQIVERLIAMKFQGHNQDEQQVEQALSPLSSAHVVSPTLFPASPRQVSSDTTASPPQIFQHMNPSALNSSSDANAFHLPLEVTQQLQEFFYASNEIQNIPSLTSRTCSPRVEGVSRLSNR
jgi:serine/threonine protein kinase